MALVAKFVTEFGHGAEKKCLCATCLAETNFYHQEIIDLYIYLHEEVR